MGLLEWHKYNHGNNEETEWESVSGQVHARSYIEIIVIPNGGGWEGETLGVVCPILPIPVHVTDPASRVYIFTEIITFA